MLLLSKVIQVSGSCYWYNVCFTLYLHLVQYVQCCLEPQTFRSLSSTINLGQDHLYTSIWNFTLWHWWQDTHLYIKIKWQQCTLSSAQHFDETCLCFPGAFRWPHPPDRQRPSDSPCPEERYRHLSVPCHGTRLHPNLIGHHLGSCSFNILLSLQSTLRCTCPIRPTQWRWAPIDQSKALVPGLHAAGGPS